MSALQACPRRAEDGREVVDGATPDAWDRRGGLTGQAGIGDSCSYCGSLHPDTFMDLVRGGWVVGPTDKTYKAYLAQPGSDGAGSEAKFYYQHLSEAQRREFVDLLAAGQMKVARGGFYVLPFFIRRGAAKTT
jgi:hypothetical protein